MKIRITFLVLLVSMATMAQVKFTVFKTVGSVQFFSVKSKQWETLKPKDSINSDTKIKCTSNSTLVIFDSKYRLYQVTQQGEFLVKNSVNMAENNSSAEMQKAVKFFVEQTFASNANGTTQKIKGAVYRGEESIFPWDSSIILEDTFELVLHFARASYPLKVTMNNYKAMIYGDTTLRIPSSYLIEKAFNVLKIGSGRELHLFCATDNKKIILSYIGTLTKPQGDATAINYSLAILNCIEMGYLDTARRLIVKASSNKKNFENLKELLKDNATATLLMKL